MGKKNNEDLSHILMRFSQHIAKKIQEYKRKGGLEHVEFTFTKPVIENLQYDKGKLSLRTSYVQKTERRSYIKEKASFLGNVINGFSEYASCAKCIRQNYRITEERAEQCLRVFASVTASEFIKSASDEDILKIIIDFLRHLDNSPINWKVKVWLIGVWLENEKYEFDNNIIIRRPTKRDLATEDEDIFLTSHMEGGYHTNPDSILEFITSSLGPDKAQREIQETLETLRLFRLGSVDAITYFIYSQSVFKKGGISKTPSNFSAIYKYGLSASDRDHLNEFVCKIRPLLPADPALQQEQMPNLLGIALKRYGDALLAAQSVESRITSTITSLESLYLKANERSELSHRLAQRIAALLRLSNFTPIEVYKNIREAYEIRSAYIHGSTLEKKKARHASDLCKTILEYSRISLLTFLQVIGEQIEKEQFINKLDNSLLEETAQKKVRELVAKVMITK